MSVVLLLLICYQPTKNSAHYFWLYDLTVETKIAIAYMWWNYLRRLNCCFVLSADFVGDRRSGINQAVVDEVQSVFRGKTLQQLELLEKTIRNKLHGGEGVDVGTWCGIFSAFVVCLLQRNHIAVTPEKYFRLAQCGSDNLHLPDIRCIFWTLEIYIIIWWDLIGNLV